MATTTANSSNVKEYLKIGGYLFVGYLGYKALKGLAETFGLLQTQSEQNLDTASDSASGDSTTITTNSPFLAFNPNYAPALVKAYLKKYPTRKWNATAQMKIGQAEFIKLATRLYYSKDLFDDDEDAVYDVFRTIQTQWQLSLLSSVFHYFFKKDLLEYLKKFMNADEMDKLLTQVKNYPQYFK